MVALAARHVESGRTWRHNEHLALPSASSIKLAILAAFWQIQDRLARRLPDGLRIANKTGNFADVIHDVGIVTWACGTHAVQPPREAMDDIADIATTLVHVCGQ